MKPVKVCEFEERVLKAPLQVAINVVVGSKSDARKVTFSLASGDALVDPKDGDITLPGEEPVEIHFHLAREGWEGTVAFEDINNWPLIAGYKKLIANLPKSHSHVEFGVPERPGDTHVQVLYKRVNPDRSIAYNLGIVAKERSSRVHEVFSLDPRIINKPK